MNSPIRFRFALLRCARLFSDEVNTLLTKQQLNYSLWQTLVIIHLNPNCTALDIANELSISKPAVTKRLNTLTDLGFIQYGPVIDKRQKAISLSEICLKRFQLCSTQIDELENQILSSFDQTALQQSHLFNLELMDKLQARKDQNHE